MRASTKRMIPVLISSVALSGVAPAGFAQAAFLEPVTLSSADKFDDQMWLYGLGAAPKTGLEAMLAQARLAKTSGDAEGCLKSLKGARSRAKTVSAWVVASEIECAMILKASKASSDVLHEILERVDRNSTWMLKGPAAASLRSNYVKGRLSLLDQDVKTNRLRGWVSVERLQELSVFLDDKSRARMYRSAAEIAFLQQKSEAARDLLKRSLLESDSSEARARLTSIESQINGGAPKGEVSTVSSGRSAPLIESSKGELELVERITVSLKSGDLVAAVEDAVKLTRDYPGSTRAKWASDRAYDAYLSVADRNDTKSAGLRGQVVKAMAKAESERTYEWGRLLFNRGQFEDSLALAKQAAKEMSGAGLTRALDLAAKAAVANDQFEIAQEYFSQLTEKHSGTPLAREAYMRSGLALYRLGKYDHAIAEFERVIAIPDIESFEVIARYWLWRALQKTKSDRADLVADALMKRFPFSYYGLRARIERSGGVLDWKDEPGSKDKSVVESKMWLTASEKEAWSRAQVLLKAGWLDEAQIELKELPPALNAQDRAVRGLLLASAGQFVGASRLINDAWDERPEFRRAPFINAAFPTNFEAVVKAQAESRKIDATWVKGLIKQESGYNVRAVSSSNAMGLMQMIPPTAREIAQDLRLGTLDLPEDMFQPQRNIQMGTYYIARMISKFQGSVPFGLAAYNAGPTRIDKWIRSKPSLKDVPAMRSSQSDNEIWIDELPYWETSFYVKSILRNILIYRMLEKGRVEVGEPIWSSAK